MLCLELIVLVWLVLLIVFVGFVLVFRLFFADYQVQPQSFFARKEAGVGFEFLIIPVHSYLVERLQRKTVSNTLPDLFVTTIVVWVAVNLSSKGKRGAPIVPLALRTILFLPKVSLFFFVNPHGLISMPAEKIGVPLPVKSFLIKVSPILTSANSPNFFCWPRHIKNLPDSGVNLLNIRVFSNN